MSHDLARPRDQRFILSLWAGAPDGKWTIEITKRKNKILVAGIYKPPNLSVNDFTTSLETIISKLSNKNEDLILIGDFNVTTNNPN